MPTYHFHARDGRELPDPDGTSVEDDAGARVEALRYMAEMLRDRPELLFDTGSFQLTVADDRGLTLFVFDLSVTTSPAVSKLD